ncbi:transglycosylase SLT domain-containing protein [Actinoplanes sp. NPDC049316]|uniref:aggregation-promoting factor C-terminal-like domain-containing protein n=1 Tax=Actinoplanes sp. NPDC049316 TaxID=3154727 RepID=UPI0034464C19
MDGLWSRVGVRATSVGLLVAGVIGGIHLGQMREDQQQEERSRVAVRADAADLQLLQVRETQQIAARAWRHAATSDAAGKAAGQARAAAAKARKQEKKAIERKAAEENGTVPFAGEIPSSCKEYSGNRAIGCALTLEAGFGLAEFPCLNKLWNHESGWNEKAANPSGAYGIPQALPGSKMGTVASDWKTNPATQIKWGLGYIKGRYDTPCGAWSHFQSNNSY